MNTGAQNTSKTEPYGDVQSIANRIPGEGDSQKRSQVQSYMSDMVREAQEFRRYAFEQARFSELPEHTYRLLKHTDKRGSYYELELDGESYSLFRNGETKYDLRGIQSDVISVARGTLRKLIGCNASEKARFIVMYGKYT